MKMEKINRYFHNIGNFAIFARKAYKSVFPWPKFKNIFKDLYEMSIKSFPIVALTSSFMGLIMTYQLIYELRKYGLEVNVGGIVGVAVTRELGPVFAALILAGRLSSAIAAEIGSMKISEQIDALKLMSVDPLNYLVAPRLIAAILMVPLLTVFADAIAIFSGFLVSYNILDMSLLRYIDKIQFHVVTMDILSGLIKSLFFSQVIVMVGAFFGYTTEGGAEGVGKSTTNAVVYASVLILLVDYFLTALFFG
ncbi:MAG: ABC transporter permease [Candidatus Mcinerneyibacterium aminivorans]|uniref:ABC transporter permease n=1 Tax=Candidatus Mcinerneyibacterium aminivorans TaxID=2703815 RepID=A0A5D0MB84_9BACT|nr:MAG: ABC transporter permease [Candidatus Mcinerneyibacterium aminivorans]